MRRFASLAILLGALSAAQSAAAQSSPRGDVLQQIFGKTPAGAATACYKRVYDAGHLAGHPQQNVTTMLLLVTSEPQTDAPPNYTANIGVTFRKRASRFEVSGSCSKGEGGLNCGVECDGGHIDVALRDAKSVLVKIPDGARVSRAGSDAEVTGRTFGSDDKVFRLDRTRASDCIPIAFDPKVRAQLRRGG